MASYSIYPIPFPKNVIYLDTTQKRKKGMVLIKLLIRRSKANLKDY